MILKEQEKQNILLIFQNHKENVFLGLHHNRGNSFLFVSAEKIYRSIQRKKL